MRRFKSAEHAQQFLGPFGAVGDHFRVGRYRPAAAVRRQLLAERHSTWRQVVSPRGAAWPFRTSAPTAAGHPVQRCGLTPLT
jgi:hypothetical protein